MRTWAAVALLVCCWVSAAYAGARDVTVRFEGMEYSLKSPSAIYTEAAELAPIRVTYLKGEELAERCADLLEHPEPMGCAHLMAPYVCVVYINSEMSERMQRIVLRHEDAHCRGWPGDHP